MREMRRWGKFANLHAYPSKVQEHLQFHFAIVDFLGEDTDTQRGLAEAQGTDQHVILGLGLYGPQITYTLALSLLFCGVSRTTYLAWGTRMDTATTSFSLVRSFFFLFYVFYFLFVSFSASFALFQYLNQ